MPVREPEAAKPKVVVREKSSHFVLRLALKFALTILLVWAMATYMDQYFFVTGGFPAWLIIGALLTLMNMFVRPLLNLITLPLRLLASIVAIILVNAVFLWLTVQIVKQFDPAFILLDIQGGIGGWIVVALTLGFANWLIKHVVR
jgi:putative membrane protein